MRQAGKRQVEVKKEEEEKVSVYKIRIDEAELHRLEALSFGEREKEVESRLPEDIRCGYGYYGHTLRQDNGECFIVCNVGDSCD